MSRVGAYYVFVNGVVFVLKVHRRKDWSCHFEVSLICYNFYGFIFSVLYLLKEVLSV